MAIQSPGGDSMTTNTILDSERWMLSFYRTSEITGALFFGRLAKSLPAGPMQADLTQHFSDESSHASLWTQALTTLGCKPDRIACAYQDAYLDAAGLPVNIMEILAITQVFERRVMQQYARHSRLPNLHPVIADTLKTIMADERWHIDWVGRALRSLEPQFGAERIRATLARYKAADADVYANVLDEHRERLGFLLDSATEHASRSAFATAAPEQSANTEVQS